MTTGGDDIDRAYFADGTPDLSEHSPAYGVETIAQALLNIYREVVDVEGGIEPNLYQETRRIFSEAVADGWVKASDRDIPTPDQAFRDAFLHSADVFSAFRVHRMQQDIAAQMIDSNGNVKPFRKFVKDVSPYIEHRNRQWLQTEYNTAILRAQNAAEWQQFMAEKDVFPNLEWIPSTSPNPGEDHRVFWGTVRPVDDPFWNVHKPGDRWNCKCELRQTEKAVTPVPTSRAKALDNAAKGLESNPAKDKEVFSDKHPYYPKNCSVCPFAGNKLMALVHDLAGGKDCHHCRRVDNKMKRANTDMPSVVIRDTRPYVTINTDRRQFKQQRKDTGKVLQDSFPNGESFGGLYSGKIYINKDYRGALLEHCYDTDELNAVEHSSDIIPKLRNGEYLEIDKNNHLYEKKIERGWNHMVCYKVKINGIVYEFKTAMVKTDGELKEYPYSFKKEKANTDTQDGLRTSESTE